MKVVVTGGAGFIGRGLVDALIDRGHDVTVIDRHIVLRQAGVTYHQTDILNERIHPEWLDGVDALIHLTGAPLAGKRWSTAYRKELYDSRIVSAKRIIQVLRRIPSQRRPKTVITASAIGIYGDRGEEILTEVSEYGQGFLSDICREWEDVWDDMNDTNVRVVSVRNGIVLHEAGGIVTKLRPLVLWGLGTVFGTGRQWVSWISLQDVVAVYVLALEDASLEGPINAVVPQPLRQRDFIKRIATRYHRPVFFDLPSWLIRLVAGGASAIVLDSCRVKPTVLLARGFTYRHTTIRSALDT